MSSFCSFLVFRPDEFELVRSLCADASWSVRGITDPSKRYRFFGSGWAEVSKASALPESSDLRDDEEFGQVLVFETEQDEADNAIELIRAANLILEGFPDQFSPSGHGFAIPDDPTEREEIYEQIFRKTGYFEKFTFRQTLPVAVAVAAKAWSDSRLVYAVHKLALSLVTESVTPHSMHPRHKQVFEKHSGNFSSHVGTSVAINLAYSAIQELGLDVRASGKNRRWSDNEDFVWNQDVLEGLKTRLKDSGIDPDRTIDWVVRGEKSEVEVHPIRDSLTAQSDGGVVRDLELSLPDAINRCEHLRNFMTAHAFSRSTPLLGPYEVYNTQQVARFLMLSKCGLWNVWTEELRVRYS
ncbi:MAG: hypothetical protein AAGJ34_09570 [Pseudomonadota bacterium]